MPFMYFGLKEEPTNPTLYAAYAALKHAEKDLDIFRPGPYGQQSIGGNISVPTHLDQPIHMRVAELKVMAPHLSAHLNMVWSQLEGFSLSSVSDKEKEQFRALSSAALKQTVRVSNFYLEEAKRELDKAHETETMFESASKLLGSGKLEQDPDERTPNNSMASELSKLGFGKLAVTNGFIARPVSSVEDVARVFYSAIKHYKKASELLGNSGNIFMDRTPNTSFAAHKIAGYKRVCAVADKLDEAGMKRIAAELKGGMQKQMLHIEDVIQQHQVQADKYKDYYDWMRDEADFFIATPFPRPQKNILPNSPDNILKVCLKGIQSGALKHVEPEELDKARFAYEAQSHQGRDGRK